MYRKSESRRACFLGIFRELCALALRLVSPLDDLAAALRQPHAPLAYARTSSTTTIAICMKPSAHSVSE
jgi:hypothetical protein